MPVVNRNGTLHMTNQVVNPGQNAVDRRYSGAEVRTTRENFGLQVGDTATSTYTVARLPRNAVLIPGMFTVQHSANLPASISLGDATFPNGLINAYNGSAGAGSTTYLPALASIGQELWQLLGYASAAAAPAMITLIITRNTAGDQVALATGWVHIGYTVG